MTRLSDKSRNNCRQPAFTYSADAGFTLVELLVVLAIIGLVAALATPQVLRYLASAKVSTTQAQLKNIGSALELYYLDAGAYPSTETGLQALISAPVGASAWNGPYLKTGGALRDSWGNDFKYDLGAENGLVTITSFGRDGKPQGEGVDADLQYTTQ
jgi:general secretion pathway protein G